MALLACSASASRAFKRLGLLSRMPTKSKQIMSKAELDKFKQPKRSHFPAPSLLGDEMDV
jgi:hypothetical protein